jgi:hypothetical protein
MLLGPTLEFTRVEEGAKNLRGFWRTTARKSRTPSLSALSSECECESLCAVSTSWCSCDVGTDWWGSSERVVRDAA